MAKIIRINSERFVLPEGMSTKDIQALAGFLFTLQSVGSEYNYDNSDYMYYPSTCAQVQLEELALITKAEATEQGNTSRKAYLDRQAA